MSDATASVRKAVIEMFAQPSSRIVWPIVWIFVAPMLALLLWQVAIEILPVPHPVWGTIGTIAIVAIVAWLPLLALRRSMASGHTAGTVLGTISLVWVLLVTIGIAGLTPA